LAVNWHTNIVNKKYFPQNDDVIFFLNVYHTLTALQKMVTQFSNLTDMLPVTAGKGQGDSI